MEEFCLVPTGKPALSPAGSEPLARGMEGGGNNSAVICALASEKSGRCTPTPSRGGRGSPAPEQRLCLLPCSLRDGSGSAVPKGPSSPPKKSQSCAVRESTSSPSYLESSFLPQNCPKGQCGCEAEQEFLLQTRVKEPNTWLGVGSRRCSLSSGGIGGSFQHHAQ